MGAVMARKTVAVIPAERVLDSILTLRDKRVILDSDLAKFYGVETKRLNEAVRRNAEKFPSDFSFVLNKEEVAILRSQIATSSSGYGGRRYMPRAFTEHGAIMAATLLSSPQAVQMSILVVRAFVKMREELAGHRQLALRLKEIERQLTDRLDGHEQTILELLEQMKAFMYPPVPKKEPIGFRETGSAYRISKKRKAA
jgi:hypothetical protein